MYERSREKKAPLKIPQTQRSIDRRSANNFIFRKSIALHLTIRSRTLYIMSVVVSIMDMNGRTKAWLAPIIISYSTYRIYMYDHRYTKYVPQI